MFPYLGKNVVYPENCCWYVLKNFLRPPPPLLEASYAPAFAHMQI